jgi:LysM repeat protein
VRSARPSPRLALCLALMSTVLLQLSLPPVSVEAAPPASGGQTSGNSSLAPPSGSGRDGSGKGTPRRRTAEPPAASRGSTSTAAKTGATKHISGKARAEKSPSTRTTSSKAPARTTPSKAAAARGPVHSSQAKSVTAKAPARPPATARAEAPASAPEAASTDARSASPAAKAAATVARRSRADGALAACSYTVRKGDNLGRIAARHGVSPAALVSTNHLPRQGGLPVGKRLTIPDCEPRATPERPTPPPEAWADGVHQAKVGPRRVPTALHLGLPDIRNTVSTLLWPVAGPVASPFGLRRSGWHAGIDIKADVGTPILAAAAGTVLVSAWERAYGRVIKIEHDDGFVTLYAHNLQNFVSPGDRVEAGAVIGTVGRSGRSTAYHLHFEVRRDGMAFNPLHILPERDVMVARAEEAGDTDAEEAEDEPGR